MNPWPRGVQILLNVPTTDVNFFTPYDLNYRYHTLIESLMYAFDHPTLESTSIRVLEILDMLAAHRPRIIVHSEHAYSAWKFMDRAGETIHDIRMLAKCMRMGAHDMNWKAGDADTVCIDNPNVRRQRRCISSRFQILAIHQDPKVSGQLSKYMWMDILGALCEV